MKKKIILTLFNFCYVFYLAFLTILALFLAIAASYLLITIATLFFNCIFYLQLQLYIPQYVFFGPTLNQVALNTVYLYLN